MKTAMQDHIQWLEDTLSIAKETAPILQNTIKLVLVDANRRLELEKLQIQLAFQEGWSTPHGEKCPQSGKEYFNQTYKQP